MEILIKAKIDTINLNIKVQDDLTIVHRKRNYEMIELYPKLQSIFKVLNIPEEKFKMRDKRVSSKVFINHQGIYLEFKTIPPRPNETINHSLKLCHLQLKGEWFLENEYSKFLDLFEALNVDSTSKIEIAFDFIEDKNFLKDTMNVFLNHRDKIKKLSGENKIIFNLDHETQQSIHFFNASKTIKIYDKSIQLKKDKKREEFYLKNPDFLGKNHFRIELALNKSSIIDKNLSLKELILNKTSEKIIIDNFVNYFFDDFYIEKSSQIKKILQLIQKKKF